MHADLDPQGLRYKPRGGPDGGGRGRGGAIGADAGEVHGGKIDWGYLKGEVKQYGEVAYDMLGEEEEQPPQRAGALSCP